MAKQTFTTGQVLTAAQMTSLQQTAMGGGSATAKTASYTLVAADAGATVIMNSASATTITVNTSLFSAGDTVFIQNIGAGVSTITAGTATVSTASSLALAQYESGTLYFTAAGVSIFSKADGASASGGGKVLQMQNVIKSDVFTTTSTSLVDVTGLTVSITPTLATSTILVMTTFMYSSNSGTGYPRVVMKRDSTTIFAGTPVSLRPGALNQTNVYNADSNYALQVAANFIDSPATTSALTYKIQALQTSGNTTRIGATGDDPDSASFGPRFASSIVLLEIGA